MEGSLVDRLFRHTLLSPLAIAFRILGGSEEEERIILYQELESKVKGLACQLADKQWRGARALLVYQDIPEFIIALLACQYAGIVAVPVPYVRGNRQWDRLQYIVEDAEASAILCCRDSVTHLKKGLQGMLPHGETMIFATDDMLPQSSLSILPEPAAEEIAFLQYTSGSTGNPKGVVITTGNLMHNQQLIENTFGCNKDSVIFSWLPFHHDMGLIGNILHTLYVGCTGILLAPLHFIQKPQRWLQSISRYGVTHSGGPNFAYDLCVDRISPDELATLDLSGWKVAYNGAEPVRYETMQRFAEYFKPAGFRQEALYPCYGLAETTLLVAGAKKTELPRAIFIAREQGPDGRIVLKDKAERSSLAIVSSGAVVAGMEVRIISGPDSLECPELVEGEICISGGSVTGGYWNRNNDDLFYETDNRKFLRTGDLGFFYQGSLFVHGRLTEMMIIRGKNVYPSDIEQLIAENNPAIEANGIAVFCTDASREEVVIIAEIRRTLIRELDAGSVIRAIDRIVMGAFSVSPKDILLTTPLGIPRTTSGKLQRVKCREMYRLGTFKMIALKSELFGTEIRKEKNAFLLAEALQNVNYTAISNYLANIISSRMGDLHLDSLQDKTELTEIGIDSLRATELINFINKEMGINIDITSILLENTFLGLITTVETLLWLKNAQPSGEEITI